MNQLRNTFTLKRNTPQQIQNIIDKYIRMYGQSRFNDAFLPRDGFNRVSQQQLQLYSIWNRKQYRAFINCEMNIKILLQISHIKYENLLRMDLQCNFIQNIEPISWIFCPLLQRINLQENQIVKVKSLCKSALFSMKQLNLNVNRYNYSQLFYFNRLSLTKSQKLQQMHLDSPRCFYGSNVQLSCTQQLIKFEAKKINNDIAYSKLRTKKLGSVFREKFSYYRMLAGSSQSYSPDSSDYSDNSDNY